MIMNVLHEFIVSVEPQVIGLETPMTGLGAGYCRKTQRMLLFRSLDWEPQVIGLGVWAWKRKKNHIHDKHVRGWFFFKLRELISETPGVDF